MYFEAFCCCFDLFWCLNVIGNLSGIKKLVKMCATALRIVSGKWQEQSKRQNLIEKTSLSRSYLNFAAGIILI